MRNYPGNQRSYDESACIYCRVSDEDDVRNSTIEIQEDIQREFFENKRWTLEEIFPDEVDSENQLTEDKYAVIYCRLPNEREKKSVSIEMQVNVCREYCQDMGMRVALIVLDDEKSENPVDSSYFDQSIRHCFMGRDGDGYFLVYSPEQISYNVFDFCDLKLYLFMQYGVQLISTTPYYDVFPETEFKESI